MTREVQTMAVLFADICDSTALYQKLGDVAARSVVDSCMSLIVELLPQYSGRLVKTIGDAAMCIFPTPDLAVLAASSMQSSVHKIQPTAQPVELHIGVHAGRVLLDHGDVFGDTVNIAAYLTAVATAEQIVTTESTRDQLSDELRSCVRPIFNTILKGSGKETVVYQVLWRTDRAHLTDVNMQGRKVIPGDMGSLLVSLNEERLRIDQWRTTLTIGRDEVCDLRVGDSYASRHHATVRLMRTHFYLIDHSINGTYVSLDSGEEVHVLRGELLLGGSGKIILGRSRDDEPREVISFSRDRRSMFRI